VKHRENAHRPSAAEFRAAVLEAFAFLRKFGFEEVNQSRTDDPFHLVFSNATLTLNVQGTNWGLHADAGFTNSLGEEAPAILFVPREQRGETIPVPEDLPPQLGEVFTWGYLIERYCSAILGGDMEAYGRVAKEWRRMTDPNFARSLQAHRLP
jgi:hypothetical protein